MKLMLFYNDKISNHVHYKMWDETIYPFPNFNGCTVDVWKWINNSRCIRGNSYVSKQWSMYSWLIKSDWQWQMIGVHAYLCRLQPISDVIFAKVSTLCYPVNLETLSVGYLNLYVTLSSYIETLINISQLYKSRSVGRQTCQTFIF